MKKLILSSFLVLGTMIATFGQIGKPMVHQEIELNGDKIWVGEIAESNLKNDAYGDWYNANKSEYSVNEPLVAEFKNDLQDVDIKVFMGTWCGDSQQWVPAFYKVMDAAGFPENKIQMFAVNREKKSLSGEEEGLNVNYVPTFIFYRDGKELGRIVESPINSLEEDIRDILAGTPQTPNYAE